MKGQLSYPMKEKMVEKISIVAVSTAKPAGITACSHALLAILLLMVGTSSSAWAQGVNGWNLTAKTCSDGKLRYACPGDLVATQGGNGSGSLILVDGVTGKQSVISQGGLLQETSGVAVEANGNLVATNRLSGLVRVKLADGSQTSFSPYNNLVNDYFGITLAPDGVNFVVTDSGLDTTTTVNGVTRNVQQQGRVLQIDASTGVVQVLAQGAPIAHPYGVAI